MGGAEVPGTVRISVGPVKPVQEDNHRGEHETEGGRFQRGACPPMDQQHRRERQSRGKEHGRLHEESEREREAEQNAVPDGRRSRAGLSDRNGRRHDDEKQSGLEKVMVDGSEVRGDDESGGQRHGKPR